MMQSIRSLRGPPIPPGPQRLIPFPGLPPGRLHATHCQRCVSVGFGCRDAGLYVGYPTIIGSDRLPQGGVRPTGIVPDVSVEEGVDPIRVIVEYYYERNRERER